MTAHEFHFQLDRTLRSRWQEAVFSTFIASQQNRLPGLAQVRHLTAVIAEQDAIIAEKGARIAELERQSA